MPGSVVTELRRRWTPARLDAIQLQVAEQSRIVRGPHRLVTEWGETEDGLTDLRGLVVGRHGLQFRFVTLERLDLRHARGRLSFFECELLNCRFDGASLSSQPRFDRRFERCSFRDATMKELTIGPQLVDCDFTRADVRNLRTLPNTRFERCAFDGADLSGAEFADAVFVECTFVDATFSSTTSFTRCTLVGTDIEHGLARMTRVSCDGVELPDQWAGEAEAAAAFDRYVGRYVAKARTGGADDLPLAPGS